MNLSRTNLIAMILAASTGTAVLADGGSGADHAAAPHTPPATAAPKPATAKPAPKAAPKPEASAPRSAQDPSKAPAPADAAKADAHGEKAPTPPPAHAGASDGPTAARALAWLTEGNARFASSKAENPNSDSARISEVATGQHPFATILTCADSRIPVERVFDRGVGDLFVIRVAGNVAGESETGTIEYGAGHLHTPLLVVMGHTACGAVNAAASNAELHGAVARLVERIKPAVEEARSQYPELKPEQIAPIAVRVNVWKSVATLIGGSDEIRSLVSEGKLEVVGAIYDINSGRVHFLGEHPAQSDLLKGGAATAEIEAKPARGDAHADAESTPSEKSH